MYQIIRVVLVGDFVFSVSFAFGGSVVAAFSRDDLQSPLGEVLFQPRGGIALLRHGEIDGHLAPITSRIVFVAFVQFQSDLTQIPPIGPLSPLAGRFVANRRIVNMSVDMGLVPPANALLDGNAVLPPLVEAASEHPVRILAGIVGREAELFGLELRVEEGVGGSKGARATCRVEY